MNDYDNKGEEYEVNEFNENPACNVNEPQKENSGEQESTHYNPEYSMYKEQMKQLNNRTNQVRHKPLRGYGTGKGAYQYNPNTGWQRADSEPNSGESYEWNLNDYDQFNTAKRKKANKRGVVVFSVFLVIIMGISISVVGAYSGNNYRADGKADASAFSQPETSRAQEHELPEAGISLELSGKPQINDTIPVGGKMTIPEIAKAVLPSVVGVSAHQSTRYYEPVSMGSGIIMSADGYIITNAHVVSVGTYFAVQLDSETSLDAVLIGADPTTDLAVLKVDKDDLIAATFGDSNYMEVGETVVAIGNPSGIELAGSVTRGIVSALNRQVTTNNNYSFKYIQTDAAINPGNSGGALVNEYGQVIGINSSKIIASGYEGIGFAIPITDAKPILDDIIANGYVTGRVMLGVTCQAISDADARDYGVPLGLEIIEISPKSDLINKDVQRGDIITRINGSPVYSNSDVQKILKQHEVGDTVTLTIYRRVTPVREIEFEVEVVLVEN